LPRVTLFIFAVLVCVFSVSSAQDEKPLYYDSDTYEYIRGIAYDTVFMTGDVEFRFGAVQINSDTAIWVRGQKIILLGDVKVEDSLYLLLADRTDYFISSKLIEAYGDSVILVSEKDSIKAVGPRMFYHRDSAITRMFGHPTVYIDFQDTSKMATIDADRIVLNSDDKIAYADGNVSINQNDTKSSSGRAIMYLDDNILFQTENPKASRRESEISGDTLIFYSENDMLERIYVSGNAKGDFKEPSANDTTVYDISEVEASVLDFQFKYGELDRIIAAEQAYSYYFPGTADSSEIVKNIVSGDTIKLFMEDEELDRVEVIGGAEGEYMTGKYETGDSATKFIEDTVRYSSRYIDFSLEDSIITLNQFSRVSNDDITLRAYRIKYNTASRLVFAYDDTAMVDTTMTYIPVVLKDQKEEIFGSYLEYSMETERGMIKQSRTDMGLEQYTGEELYRHEKNVFYVEDGTYCSCEYKNAGYHFWADKMKMIQDDKLIARPVVFYIEKLPIFIIPYYVFPTRTDRHSGFLSFKLGNFERGDRSIANVGYYWAASEYFDLEAAFDYYEEFGLTYRAKFRYNVRYKFSGSISGSYANESRWINFEKQRNIRWRISFDHNQTLSQTMNLRADGTFLSDKRYYTDYSTDLDQRLNRNLKSQASLSKTWKGASFSAQVVHEEALDEESRTDRLPTATLSFSSKPLFGSPEENEEGIAERQWYHSIYYNYRVNLNNYSRRTTDTAGVRSRREFLTTQHSASLSSSFKLLKYLKLNPGISFTETWYKIFATDQSHDAGIDSEQFYRRFAYSASVKASTDLYGTVEPNLFGLTGLRHVVTPSVTYSWAPEITQNDAVRNYTGTGGGGAKRSSVSMSLRHLFQAKVSNGKEDRKIDLFTVNSSLSYNFEAEQKKFSNLNTTISTSLLRNITLSGSFVHDLYNPSTDELEWWSPYLQSMTISTNLRLGGSLGEYEWDRSARLRAGFEGKKRDISTIDQKWTAAITHHYSESGRGEFFNKTHWLSLNLNTTLTPTIRVRYSQNYDIGRHKTISRSIEITKDLKCWEGRFYWVIDGSNRGFYFRINIITIPDIKFEKSETGVRSGFF